MVQLSTVIAVLAAASLPTAYATDESHLDERSLEAQTSLGGAPPQPAALPFHAIGIVIPSPSTLKDDSRNVKTNLKGFIAKEKSAVKARIGIVKTKATKEIKFAKTTIKQVGSQVKLKIGSDLRKGIHKFKEGVRKGEGRLGRHRKFRKFHGRLGRKHGQHRLHKTDEFDTEVIIIIKQHGKHRGGHGRKHRGGRKHFGHGRKQRGKKMMKQHPSMMEQHPSMIMKHEPAMTMHEPSMMAPPPTDKSMMAPPPTVKSMAMPATKGPDPSNKMVKTSMSNVKSMVVKSKAMPADPLAGGDPSLGPFFSVGTPAVEPTAPIMDMGKEMKAEASMGKPAAVAASALVAPAAAPIEKTVHPVTMPW